MSLITQLAGCKVGWEVYSTAAEADAASVREAERRERQLERGYDFGYQWPGAVKHFLDHPDYGECWIVVTT